MHVYNPVIQFKSGDCRRFRPESRLVSILDDLIQFNVVRSAWTTTREKVFKDGRRINIGKLANRVKNRPVKSVPIADLGAVDRSRRTGFSLKRLANADTRRPILIDSNNEVLDGRHRVIKHQSEGHRKIKAIRVTDKDLKATEFAALHQPKKQDEPPGELPTFREGELIDYNVQRHHARKAGLHRDVRVGNPKHGLLSWATRKKVPGPGEKIPIHQQPTHPHSYLGWSGTIPEGYGAGTVKSEDLGKALVTKSTPSELHATLADRKGTQRIAFLKTKSGWLHTRGSTPQPPPEAQKPPAKSLSPQEAKGYLSKLEPGSIVQPKIDGALVYVSTKGGRPEVFSHRVAKSGEHPIHTERIFHGRPSYDIPKEHQHTLVSELYGKVKGKSIPPQDLGGLLNTHIGESISKQKQRGVRLKMMPFDIADQRKNEPYPERLQKVKATLKYLPRNTFHAPEEAKTPSAALRLYEKVRSGHHPLTKEGIIIHPPQGKMIKVKNVEEANVKIHSTFPGTGRFRGSPGGFVYSDTHGRPLGKVGTGFSDETRRDLDKYVGRTARVRYQEKYKSGKLRAPVFIAVEENK